MPTTRSQAQQAASRTNGTRSHGPATEAGQARSAQNDTRHGLRGGLFALLPGEDGDELARLHAAVTSDWGPRDAYERRWVMELVTAMWRQERLRGLELTSLATAAAESPPSEATVKRFATFARYGAWIDKDIGRALQALRVLRDRPDAWIDELRNGTPEPAGSVPHDPEHPGEPESAGAGRQARAQEPGNATSGQREATDRAAPRTSEPDLPAPPPAGNRQQRRRLEALARQAQRRAA